MERIFIICLLLSAGLAYSAQSRIKDIVNIRGVRSNEVMGIGLVVGLAGTGDTASSIATNTAAAKMITKLGIKTTSDQVVSGSMAIVVVTAEMAAFAKNGDKFDVKLSTLGDATSLAGGTLMRTPLKAGDSKIYVMAHGAVSVGQATGTGSQVITVARVPNGAVVEREFSPNIAPMGRLTLSLKNPDFTTNMHVAEAINAHFKGFYAASKNISTINVKVPPLFRDRLVEFIASMEKLTVTTDQKARVIINERTGTVVMGDDVGIDRVSISHGGLSIQVGEAKGAIKNESVIAIGGTTVGDLLSTLNELGVKPADLVSIFQAIKASGALQAELEFM